MSYCLHSFRNPPNPGTDNYEYIPVNWGNSVLRCENFTGSEFLEEISYLSGVRGLRMNMMKKTIEDVDGNVIGTYIMDKRTKF